MKVGKERYEQRRLQNLIILGISVLVLMAALVTMVGLPTAASVLIAGLVVLAMVSLTRALVESSVGAASEKERYMETTYRSRRTQLLVILGVSMAILVGTVAYAFSLESWGDMHLWVFNIVGFASMAFGLVALVLLIADFAQARRG
jgi:MFS family permease